MARREAGRKQPKGTWKARWGDVVLDGGFTPIPDLLLDYYRRLKGRPGWHNGAPYLKWVGVPIRLSPSQLLTLVFCVRYHRAKGQAMNPTVAQIADDMMVTHRAVQLHLSELEKMGLLRRTAVLGEANEIDLSGLLGALRDAYEEAHENGGGVKKTSPPVEKDRVKKTSSVGRRKLHPPKDHRSDLDTQTDLPSVGRPGGLRDHADLGGCVEPKPPGEVEEVLPVWVEPGEATGQEALPGPALGEEDSVGGRNGAFPDGWHVGRGKTGLRELRRQAERCDETGEGAAAAVARITAAAAERMSKHPVYRAKFGEHGPRDGAGEAARMVWEVELARCTAWWMEKRTGKDEG